MQLVWTMECKYLVKEIFKVGFQLWFRPVARGDDEHAVGLQHLDDVVDVGQPEEKYGF